MNAPQIRILTESDVDSYWRLRLRALKEEPISFGSSYEESVDTPLDDVARRLAVSDSEFVFGAFDPDLVGTAGFYRHKGLKVRHKGTIWGMYIAPEKRGLGLGKAILDATIKQAAKLPDLEEVQLTVVTANEPAHRLYASMGFEVYGVDHRSLRIGNEYFDETLMCLKLKMD